MNYSEIQQAVLLLATQASAANNYTPPADFTTIFPSAIAYAEGRIYREMTFLATRAADASLRFTGNTRSLNLQNMTTVIIVPEGVAAITPVGQIPVLGTRWQFQNASLDVIDISWPTESLVAPPAANQDRWWAMLDANTIVTSPTMDAAYVAEVTGLFYPAPLSATNITTYLSTVYPALLEAACMIFISGYTRNFGAQSDKPELAQSWENQYKVQASWVKLEEDRRRGAGVGWSQNAPTPLAKRPDAQ